MKHLSIIVKVEHRVYNNHDSAESVSVLDQYRLGSDASMGGFRNGKSRRA